jgi:hemerythrin
MFQSRRYGKGKKYRPCCRKLCEICFTPQSCEAFSDTIKVSQSENDICHSTLHFRPVVYQRFHFKWEEMFRKINYEKLQITAQIHKSAALLII